MLLLEKRDAAVGCDRSQRSCGLGRRQKKSPGMAGPMEPFSFREALRATPWKDSSRSSFFAALKSTRERGCRQPEERDVCHIQPWPLTNRASASTTGVGDIGAPAAQTPRHEAHDALPAPNGACDPVAS